jgi:hypothetical protein
LPSFGADAALLSQENGPVIFRDCVGGAGERLVVVFDELAAHGTPGREAENPVNLEGSGGGLEGAASGVALIEEPFAGWSCAFACFLSFSDPVDIRCAVRSGDLSILFDSAEPSPFSPSPVCSSLESLCSNTEDSDMEAFGVELEEDDEGLLTRDLPEPGELASFMPVESGASSKVS